MTTTDHRFDGPGPEARWGTLLEEGVFAIQRCHDCGAAQFPPVALCQSCGAPEPDLIPTKGTGTVYSTTTVRTREGGYNVSIVELTEGPRIMARVEGMETEAVRIGGPVIARIDTSGDAPLVVFDPAEGTA